MVKKIENKKDEILESWKEVNFLSCLKNEASSNKLKIPQSDFLDKGNYPIIDQGEIFIAGYTNDKSKVYSGRLPVIVFGDHTRILKFVNFPFAIGADGVKILVPIDNINVKYFYYALKRSNIPSAGYSRHYKFLKGLIIPVPPLDVQKKIVSILEKAETLKQQREQADKFTEDYLKSVFYEMFLKDNFKFITIKQGVLEIENKNPENDFPDKLFYYIDITSVDNNLKRIININKIVGKDAPSRAKQLVKYKDILVSTVRPNLNSVAMVPKELDNQICSTGFCVLRADNKIFIPEYLFFITKSNFFIDALVNKCKGANYPAVSSKDIKYLQIPLPHLKLQQKFASIVEHVEKLKEKQKKSKEHIDEMFNSLMQKAFKGELVK